MALEWRYEYVMPLSTLRVRVRRTLAVIPNVRVEECRISSISSSRMGGLPEPIGSDGTGGVGFSGSLKLKSDCILFISSFSTFPIELKPGARNCAPIVTGDSRDVDAKSLLEYL